MVVAERDLEARQALAERHFAAARGHERYGQALSGAELVGEFLKYVGADLIFGIPGGASLPLNDAFTRLHVEDGVRYVLTGHEQGAAFEAEGYAAASGRVGFCTGTSGPGATNLITGLADAYRDSRPVFAITGNTATTAEPEAFQAIDIVGITDGKATKLSCRPERPEQVQAALVRAYHAAVTGRPGAVLVDLPRDVQVGRAEMRPWEELLAELDWERPAGDRAGLAEAARLLASAERPLLYAGHGVALAGAASELRELSHRLGAPVATTVHGLGLMPADDPLNLGMLGMHGTIAANLAPYLADVVVALGARFDDRVVGARPAQFAPSARVVHVDVDARQLNRVRAVDLAVHADVGVALRSLLDELAAAPSLDRSGWLAQLDEVRRAMPIQSYDAPESDELSHEFVYTEMARQLRAAEAADVVATFDVGTHQMKGAQWFPVSRPRSFVTSGGMGSMGCALPMAVGAALARPAATVVASVGDGGFVMSSHELDTIGGYGIPVKVLLFDDAHLGMVTNWHGLFFGGRKLTSDRRRGRETAPADLVGLRALGAELAGALSVDDAVDALAGAVASLAADEGHQFALTAASYGIPAERVQTKAQLRAAVRRALAIPGPYLIHVVLPRQNQVYPLMQPGTSPQEIVWRESAPGSGVPVYARERFDYQGRRLRPE
ncbi:MAG TPA: thiamine pyrophosphate-dependent enzyme [Chloroflexota bacterium]|jgi:acetolactate synthase-1/2/3 large subunit